MRILPVPAALEVALSALLTIVLVRLLLPSLKAWRVGQPVREAGPESHRVKSGVPTMGGIAFILATVAVTLGFTPFDPSILLAFVMFIGYGLLGFLDDYLKVVRHQPLGLKARQKLVGELALGLFLGWGVGQWLGLPTWVAIPFTGIHVDLGWAYYPFLALAAIATANATNETDGADGLLAGAIMPVAAVLGWYAFQTGAWNLVPAILALLGAMVGFLVWNAHPARIIMGDTGSMAIGGLLVAIAALTKTELWLLVYGGLFVLETLSVIVQVASFRLFGRRVLRMSPLHHHFEVAGWPERRVVTVFWLVSAAFAALALAGLLAVGGGP